MSYGYIIVIGLLILLIGYAAGRRIGIKEGVEKGLKETPMLLKLELFEKNICPICNRKYESEVKNDNKG